MKKIITTLVLSAMIIPSLSLAATTTPIKDKISEIKQQREDLKNKIEQEKANIKAERASTTQDIKNKREEIKSEIEQRIGKKLDEKRTNIANRFEEALKKLNSLILRVETRITKAEGQNTIATSTKDLLATSKANVLLAENELTVLENKLAEPLATSTKKAYLANIKIQSDKTKETIKTARESIINTIESLKPGLFKNKVKATSTIDSTLSTSTKNN